MALPHILYALRLVTLFIAHISTDTGDIYKKKRKIIGFGKGEETGGRCYGTSGKWWKGVVELGGARVI